MRKWLIVTLLLSWITRLPTAETFFLYAHETFDEKAVMVDESAKEGVMDGLFDAGHIVFDDISGGTVALPKLIDQAFGYGADYLIILNIQSLKGETSPEEEKITSYTDYSLYDVRRDLLVGKGSRAVDNLENNGVFLSRPRFWFNLGLYVAGEIEKLYLTYQE